MEKKLPQKVINGIESINDELYDELFVNELEKRLETDPLLTNGLLDLISTDSMNPQTMSFLCEGCYSSNEYTVCKYGTY